MFSIIFAATIALAQSQPPPLFPACVEQIKSFCSDSKDARQTITCLRTNADKLSTDCQLDLQRYAQATRQAAARGGGALGDFGGMTGLTPPFPTFSYQGRFSKDLSENKVSLSSAIAGSETSMTSLSLAGGELHFKDAVTLDTKQVLPADLHRAEIGTQTSWRLDGGKSFGVRFSVGSTGDQVFQAMKDANFSAALTYSFPGSDPMDRWIALVFFANNSTLGDYIPIPGIVYIHKSEHLTTVIGFPVVVLQYTPNLQSSYSFTLFGTTLITEAAFGSGQGLQGFLQGSFNQQRYILHDRAQDRDRLSFEEKRAGVGVRAPLFSTAFGELQIGHAFDRRLYIGQKILRAESGEAILDAEAFVNAQFKYVF